MRSSELHGAMISLLVQFLGIVVVLLLLCHSGNKSDSCERFLKEAYGRTVCC